MENPLDAELNRRKVSASLQPRTARGTFLEALRPPAEVLDRRKQVIGEGREFHYAKEEWEDLAERVRLAVAQGARVSDLAKQWDLPDHSLRRALAHARNRKFSAEDREEMRQWAVSNFELIFELCIAEGNMGEARKAVNDMLKAYGIVSTGGNVLNVQNNNVMSAPAVDSAILAYIQRRDQKAIEGEVVAEES